MVGKGVASTAEKMASVEVSLLVEKMDLWTVVSKEFWRVLRLVDAMEFSLVDGLVFRQAS